MRFLADENIAHSVTDAIRHAGNDILAVQKWRSGADDADVAWKARSENRIILTHDQDFAQHHCSGGPGIILLRLDTCTPSTVAKRLLQVLGQFPEETFRGNLLIVTAESVIITRS